jgi:hypothetical protein
VEAYRKLDGTGQVAFHIHNASQMPIYEVELPLPVPSQPEPAEEFIGLVPPGPTVRRAVPALRGWLTASVGQARKQLCATWLLPFAPAGGHHAGRWTSTASWPDDTSLASRMAADSAGMASTHQPAAPSWVMSCHRPSAGL